jgi:hypothetical protein
MPFVIYITFNNLLSNKAQELNMANLENWKKPMIKDKGKREILCLIPTTCPMKDELTQGKSD